MPCDPPLNINISAYRVLFILLTLVRYRSLNAMELNRHLSENPVIGRVYNTETLTKYINTLREVGCQIPRSSSRNDYSYDLRKTPFPLSLQQEELEVAEKLLKLLAHQPDECLYKDYRDFLEQLSWVVASDALEVSDDADGNLVFPALQKRREQMNTYRRYCQEAFQLEIQMSQPGLETHTLYIEPQEMIERENHLLLLGFDQQTQQQVSLDVEHISAVKQSPTKNRRLVSRTSVVFALYGRLAAGYRLYPGERLVYRSDREVHIKTQVSDLNGLMSRLMKYGDGCQVLSPESFRDAIRQHIERLLAIL